MNFSVNLVVFLFLSVVEIAGLAICFNRKGEEFACAVPSDRSGS